MFKVTAEVEGAEKKARDNDLTIAEGKTKLVSLKEVDDTSGDVYVISKDVITAGDGAKRDCLNGKAALANQTTCNVFRLLKQCGGIPLAFIRQVNEITFEAKLCTMLPYEVVVRREAHGSCLKRMPMLTKGYIFQKLVVEYFLKTSERRWKEHVLPCDDPLMVNIDGKIALYEPSKPVYEQKPFLVLRPDEVFDHDEDEKLFRVMSIIAKKVFFILEKAWQIEGARLVDFKVEFGLAQGELVLADVIDNDSWRVVEDEAYIDKQLYRDGGNLKDVAEKYRRVAEITGRFRLPKQQIIIWCGSSNDNTMPIKEALLELCEGEIGEYLNLTDVICSMHKEPVRGLNELSAHVQRIPDTVVIACVGGSNGAGPTLSASAAVPVITVPLGYREFPEDVWSSLRTPSGVSVMTVLELSNAAIAAIGILALRNPHLYMLLRVQIESWLINTIPM